MNQIKKDAKRYAKAKMNYGDGAGIARRHLNAELEKKLADPAYAAAFEAELAKIDMEGVVREIKTKNNAKAVAGGFKKGIKTVAKVGTVAAGAYTFYAANQEGIDRIVNGVKVKVSNAINRHKYKKQIKPVSMTDAQKAEAYLKSVGIDYHYE